MAENNHTWARLVEMARHIYPNDAYLAALSVTEVFDEE
jgi:hypothetical protein